MPDTLEEIFSRAPEYRVVHKKNGDPAIGSVNDSQALWDTLMKLDEVIGDAVEKIEDNADIMERSDLRSSLRKLADMFYHAADVADALSVKVKQ